MFGSKKTILFISRNKIKIVNVGPGSKPKEEQVADIEWTSDNLAQILVRFKKNIKLPARVLLAEDFVYTANLTPLSSIKSREDVKKIAQEIIPENLDETLWDFRQLKGLGKFRLQVVAVSKTMFGFVASGLSKAGIAVEAIEPLSIALARFSQKEDREKVFVYINQDDMLLVLVQKGAVLSTEHIREISVDKITQFIKFAKDRFGIEVRDLVFCGNTSAIDIGKFKNLGFNAGIQNISPIISLAEKVDLRGRDEDVLNLFLGGGTEGGRRTPSRWRSIIVITFIIIIILAVLGFMFFQFQQTPDQNIIKPLAISQ